MMLFSFLTAYQNYWWTILKLQIPEPDSELSELEYVGVALWDLYFKQTCNSPGASFLSVTESNIISVGYEE